MSTTDERPDDIVIVGDRYEASLLQAMTDYQCTRYQQEYGDVSFVAGARWALGLQAPQTDYGAYWRSVSGGQSISNYAPSLWNDVRTAVLGRQHEAYAQWNAGGLGYVAAPVGFVLSPVNGLADLGHSYYHGRNGGIAPVDRQTTDIAMLAIDGAAGIARNVGGVANGISAAERGVWKLNPFARGQQIEQALGHNLPGNFPVIDRFENGLVTSIKSLDLDAATYQSSATLNRTMSGYIDKVAGFQGRNWAGVSIRSRDITGRALELAISHSGSATQQAIISQSVKYGASRGVTINVITFP